MKRLMALMLVATAAHADLYRWVDPQTGSVKFSSVPPPPSQAGVEVVPDRSPARPPAAKAAPAPSGVSALQLRWQQLLADIPRQFAATGPDAAMEQRVRELTAAAAELDRIDPAGADRRRAEAQAVLQRLLQGTR